MHSLLFVCLGNICRSPIAEGVAKKLSHARGVGLRVDSAGTGSWHIGEPPCPNSVKVARQNGVDISMLRGRQVTPDDFQHFDLIVALDESNYRDLKRMGCQNLVKLGSFGFEGRDVPDPYFFEGFEGFETVYAMIEKAVEKLLEERF